MNFFLIIHSVSSPVCLKKLGEKGFKPELVIAHDKYEIEKYGKIFYTPLEKFCKSKKIRLVRTDNPGSCSEIIKNFDIGFCIGYMKILRENFFETPKYGVFNLHCGKLPEYRGRAPISRTLMNGDKYLYITLHKIDEGVDSGPIAIENKMKITSKDDVNSLYEKFSESSFKPIVEFLTNFPKGKVKLKKQKKLNRTANKIISEDECKIDWRRRDSDIFNKIRALKKPYPQAFSVLADKIYKINDAQMTAVQSRGKAGSIGKIVKGTLWVNAKNRMLKISELHRDEKKINCGMEFRIGDRFS